MAKAPTDPSTWNLDMDGSLPVVKFGPDSFWTDYADNEHDHAPDGIGGAIIFQHGPVQEVGENGTQIEVVLQALIARLQGFNAPDSPFRCRENSLATTLAITHMEEALHWLHARTEDRRRRGVEGTNQA